MMPRRVAHAGRKRGILSKILSSISGLWGGGGMAYSATNPLRKIIEPARVAQTPTGSANRLLSGALPDLRKMCRDLERNNATARAAIEFLVAFVVGSGIALEPDTGDPELDDQIRDVFNRYCENCGINGESIYSLQALAMREQPTAGEALWRFVVVDEGDIPIKVLPLDAEWISDQAGAMPPDGVTCAAGMILDKYARVVGAFLGDPERNGAPEPVPASAFSHIFEQRRPLQRRGEPWLAPVIETLMNERDLVDIELKGAKTTASLGIAIESERPPELDAEQDDETDPVMSLGLGGVVRLYPGEKVHPFGHTRPSQQIAPFRKMLHGEIAAALRISARALDRDIGGATYMNIRQDAVDSERMLGPVREMLGHQTIGRLYREAAPFIAAIIGRSFDPSRYRLSPDGQPYVDPVKDVQASGDAINAGLSTLEREASKRGGDWRQITKQKSVEAVEVGRAKIEEIKALQEACEASGVPGLTWAHVATLGGATSAPGAYLAASVTAAPVEQVADGIEKQDPPAPPQPRQGEDDEEPMDRAAFLDGIRTLGRELRQPSAPPVTVEQRIMMDAESAAVMGRAIAENTRAPVVNIPAPVVHVAAPSVRVDAATVEVPAPVVQVSVEAPTVHVAAPVVTVENEVIVPQRPVRAEPQRDGSVIMRPIEVEF